MKTTNFNWGDKAIDSRDIIARYEELNDEYNSLVELVEATNEDLENFQRENGLTDYTEDEVRKLQELQEELDNAQEELEDFDKSDDKGELEMLKEIVSQGEDSPDWSYGETLIHEDYFIDYAEELVNDCYELPKELIQGTWPWNHMNMNWASAAEELKNDYSTIEVDGETYYIRA